MLRAVSISTFETLEVMKWDGGTQASLLPT